MIVPICLPSMEGMMHWIGFVKGYLESIKVRDCHLLFKTSKMYSMFIFKFSSSDTPKCTKYDFPCALFCEQDFLKQRSVVLSIFYFDWVFLDAFKRLDNTSKNTLMYCILLVWCTGVQYSPGLYPSRIHCVVMGNIFNNINYQLHTCFTVFG